MWCIYTLEYYSAITKNEIMQFAATWTQLDILKLSEVSQKKKDKYHMITHMGNLTYATNEPIYKTEADSQTWRTDLWLPRWRGKGVRWTGIWGLVYETYSI